MEIESEKFPFFFSSKKNQKRLYAFYVTKSGRWFLGFSLLIAFITLSSQNNILFLLTSFLLSTIFISGIFSDFSLYKIKTQRHEFCSYAQETISDMWIIENRSWMPLFALELGEYHPSKGYRCQIQIAYIGPKQRKIVPVKNFAYPQRGRVVWESLYMATAAPFGFAKKIKHSASGGERHVWPARVKSTNNPSYNDNFQESLHQEELVRFGNSNVIESEIRNYIIGDDWKDIVPLKSNMLAEDLKVRVRGNPLGQSSLNLRLDRVANEKELETLISQASYSLSHTKNTFIRITDFSGQQVQFYSLVDGMNYLSSIPTTLPTRKVA